MKIALLFLLFLLSINNMSGQDSSNKKCFSLTGYADLYYQYDFNNPINKSRQSFLYNFKKTNTVSVNMALIKASLNTKKIKGNLGIMLGDYSRYNLAAEPKLLQHIYEANVSYIISDKFSIDAGILPSHIGFETAIAKDNWNLSRSILAENSPYYETGIRFNFLPNEKWSTALLILNGWQHIRDDNSSKAIGSQVQFKPDSKTVFNSSIFIGNENPDSIKQLRLFHNFYFSHSLSSRFNIALLFDIGAEQQKNSKGFYTWSGGAVLLQFLISNKYSVASRWEWYKDKNQVIISGYGANPFQTMGYSINLDYKPSRFFILRTEGRLLQSAEKIFIRNSQSRSNDFSWLVSVAIFF